MDIISYSKAKKAKQSIKETQDRLGVNGTEQGLDIRDKYETVKERLDALDKSNLTDTLLNKVSDLSNHTAINLNKHSLKVKGILNQKRYNFQNMFVDDFIDSSGINIVESENINYDSVENKVSQEDLSREAFLVLTAENFSKMSRLYISSVIQSGGLKEINISLEDGKHHNTIFNEELTIKEDEYGMLYTQATYTTPVLDISHALSIENINIEKTLPEDTSVTVKASYSDDGINFSEYQNNLIGEGSYLKLKIELTSSIVSINKELDINLVEGEAKRKGDLFTLVPEGQESKLIRSIENQNGLEYNPEEIEYREHQAYGRLIRLKRTVSKGWNA